MNFPIPTSLREQSGVTGSRGATFPQVRSRRLRLNGMIRSLVRETRLDRSDFIYPLFVRHGSGEQRAIASMPGQYQMSTDIMVEYVAGLVAMGLQGVMLFGIPAVKDPVGEENFAPDGIVQQATRALKAEFPELLVVTDVCLCEYTDHGHCGVLHDGDLDPRLPSGYVLNDATLEILSRVAVSHAEAGADIVAPSAMMDGQVGAIRASLDRNGYEHLPVMAYSAKFASGFYGPFRDAAESPPSFGDRSQYQMDPANRREAVREHALDVAEGADILMVKPALAYLDIVRETRNHFDLPLAVYNVSGEYAMLKAAAANGWIEEKRVTIETMLSMKRAGADVIISYHTPDLLRWLP